MAMARRIFTSCDWTSRWARRISSAQTTTFGIRKIDYQVPDSENLTISVNGVKVMVRGGDWGLDEAMKRVPLERLDAQFHLHALANLNMIRNWVGQSTSPDFYDLADKYGILLWDEFFQPNPCGRAEPGRHSHLSCERKGQGGAVPQSSFDCGVVRAQRRLSAQIAGRRVEEADGGTGSDAPVPIELGRRAGRLVAWAILLARATLLLSLERELQDGDGSVSVPTMESIQGMMPEKDWETINDDWAQHDMASGAQRGNEYPSTLAKRYGPFAISRTLFRKRSWPTTRPFARCTRAATRRCSRRPRAC